ncbi:S8 family serine peptidase [Anaerocolumna sedimenticola]|uniref:S8 family serine peptidase n=1 Tax=Anaerocolumna sedimenticola TaxID=2696063 RepID=A0A6P1TQK0_9FIRM|nr:S8 family peptidase [Anaerocolumna sedimenticola]QHQ63540.1 S8 family serine peptidase [Anaerocolumna sedimenticola]
MTESERFKITSDEYADLIIDYNYDMGILAQYPNASYNIINQRYAVLNIPVSEMTYNAVYKYGYASIPKCYGLMFERATELDGNYYIQNLPAYDYDGEGVLIGFVDGGIEYRNKAFQYDNNTTRIVSIWDQTIESPDRYPADFYYGTEYGREEINLALQSKDPLSIVPSTEINGQGTAMAAVAAGFNSNQFSFSGTAPKAEIVAVKLKPAKPYLKEFFGISEEALCYQENDVMMGIKYLLQVAKSLHRPIVIAVGLGCNQGSHIGEDFISRYISEVGELPGVAVIVAAGDEGNRYGHYYGEIGSPNIYNIAELNIGSENENFSMELWGYPPNLLAVDIFAPNGDFVYHVSRSYKQLNTIPVYYNDTVIYIDNRLQEPFAGSQLILFRFQNAAQGVWSFQVSGSHDLVNRFHIWLPLHQFLRNIYFMNPDINTTLSIPANTVNIITVTAYNPVVLELYYYSSRGFTKTNEPKPDITAPGVNMVIPTGIDQFAYFTGTSMACAYAAGIAARLMEWGVVENNLPNMDCTFIRYILTSSARRDSSMNYPNQNWGFGILEENVFGDIV